MNPTSNWVGGLSRWLSLEYLSLVSITTTQNVVGVWGGEGDQYICPRNVTKYGETNNAVMKELPFCARSVCFGVALQFRADPPICAGRKTKMEWKRKNGFATIFSSYPPCHSGSALLTIRTYLCWASSIISPSCHTCHNSRIQSCNPLEGEYSALNH